MSPYEKSKIFSEGKLAELRSLLRSVDNADAVVVTCGSLARREASLQSDLDYFTLVPNSQLAASGGLSDKVRGLVEQAVAVEPAQDGAFASLQASELMVQDIGGQGDDNKKITRRMLFLLEGEWLFGEENFRKLRREILQKYVREKLQDHQLALFLFNDIIRYYRTMAVDYEFKIGGSGKPWGIRNIKLVFSRKLLYASGLFSVGQTADCTSERKIEVLENLFDMPVIDRLVEICGRSAMENVLLSYGRFLDKMEDAAVRAELNSLKLEDRENKLFRNLKNEGHIFTRELLRLFENRFDTTHPIRRAVVF